MGGGLLASQRATNHDGTRKSLRKSLRKQRAADLAFSQESRNKNQEKESRNKKKTIKPYTQINNIGVIVSFNLVRTINRN